MARHKVGTRVNLKNDMGYMDKVGRLGLYALALYGLYHLIDLALNVNGL